MLIYFASASAVNGSIQKSAGAAISGTFGDALAVADEIGDASTGFLIERALDEARASQFRPVRE